MDTSSCRMKLCFAISTIESTCLPQPEATTLCIVFEWSGGQLIYALEPQTHRYDNYYFDELKVEIIDHILTGTHKKAWLDND